MGLALPSIRATMHTLGANPVLLVTAWLAAIVVGGLADALVWRLLGRYRVRLRIFCRRLTRPSRAVATATRPTVYLAWLGPALTWAPVQPGRLAAPETDGPVSLGLIGHVCDTVAEELTFRGGPLALALLGGLAPAPLVGLGTLCWTLGHGPTTWLATASSGVILAGLWLTGAWQAAILLHVGGNLVAVMLDMGHQRYERWRFERTPAAYTGP